MRLAWTRPANVINHTIWDTKSSNPAVSSRTLAQQPEYDNAKRGGDYSSAFNIIERLLSTDALKLMKDRIQPERFDRDPEAQKPIVVAPVKMGSAKNLLPIACAHRIAYEFGLGVCRDIVQADNMGRTGRSGMYRLMHQPEFQGKVQRGREYVIVDDVLTMGGSLASLAGYIESNGGRVICTAVLASQMKDQMGVKAKLKVHEQVLSVQPETLRSIEKTHGWTFGRCFEKAVGFPLEALTDREGAFVSHFFPCKRSFVRAVDEERRADDGARAANGRYLAPAPGRGELLERKPT